MYLELHILVLLTLYASHLISIVFGQEELFSHLPNSYHAQTGILILV